MPAGISNSYQKFRVCRLRGPSCNPSLNRVRATPRRGGDPEREAVPISPHGPFGLPAGATGTWRSETEFLLDVNFIANINHYTLAIKFLPDNTIEVGADEASGLIRNGKLVGTLR